MNQSRASQYPAPQGPLRGSVLFVDDDPLVRRSVHRVLERAKIPHRLAAGGEEALEVFNSNPAEFSVIMADYQMPGIDGVSVLREVAVTAPWTTRVLVSGHLALNDALAAMNSGTTFQIATKPIGADALLTLIQKAQDRATIAHRNAQRLSELRHENLVIKSTNRHLENLIAERTRQLLDLVAAALDLRNACPTGRSRRLASYTRRLGEALRLDPEDLLHAEQAALLHGMATVSAPDRLIEAAMPRSPAELSQLHEHRLIGASLLERVDFLRTPGRIIRHLPERYDGTGPLGLVADAIPFGARLVRVALVLEDLTRPDSSGQPEDWGWARAEIRRQAGGSLDPEIVAAYEQVSDDEWAMIQCGGGDTGPLEDQSNMSL